MRRLPPHLAPAGYSPRRYAPLSPAPVLGMGERMTDLRDMQALFANGEQGGYWPADPQYAYEDSAGTTLASVNGVVGYRTDVACGKHAIQATTANKPYLRRTPVSNKYWLDSNTTTGALTATFASAIDNLYTAAMGRRNLFSYTQSFYASSSSWIFNSCTPIGSSETYLGAYEAKKIYPTSSGVNRYFYSIPNIVNLPTSSIYTIAVLAKAGGINCIALYIRSTQNRGIAYFDLSDGSVQVVAGALTTLTTTIQAMDDGWYYLTATTSDALGAADMAIGGSGYFLCDAKGSTTVTASGTNGVHILRPQLEANSVATEYELILAGGHTTTIASVTPEGVSILENQTVGATYNIAPPFQYNSDVLIINRALTAVEKALVTRVMQRSVPMLGSELVTNGGFETDSYWTKQAGWSISGEKAVFSPGTASRILTPNIVSSGIIYWVTLSLESLSGTSAYFSPQLGSNTGWKSFFSSGFTPIVVKSAVTCGVTDGKFGIYAHQNATGTVDNVSIKAIL